jgi:hypothetical protein
VVRHRLPLALFRLFVEPFASEVVIQDGKTSFRRSYTAGELRQITAGALAGSAATFQHSVGPFCLRQIMDITYKSGGYCGEDDVCAWRPRTYPRIRIRRVGSRPKSLSVTNECG